MNFPSYIPDDLREYTQSWISLMPEDMAVLKRLIFDTRMKKAYEYLNIAFFNTNENDGKFVTFIKLAEKAAINYSDIRERRERIERIRLKIAKKSKELSELLRILPETKNEPMGLSGIGDLLEVTPYRKMPVIIDSLSGEHNSSLGVTTFLEQPIGYFKLKFIENEISTEFDSENVFLVPPEVSDILESLTNISEQWSPRLENAYEIAISRRQNNPKNEYIRSFSTLLKDNMRISFESMMVIPDPIQITKEIKKAIAVTTAVVINDPNIDVSYEDVVDALRK